MENIADKRKNIFPFTLYFKQVNSVSMVNCVSLGKNKKETLYELGLFEALLQSDDKTVLRFGYTTKINLS